MPISLALYYLTVIAITFVTDDTSSDFNDLGKQLLGGFVLAVVVGVVYTILKLRWRDKNPPASFISINTSEKVAEPSKVNRE